MDKRIYVMSMIGVYLCLAIVALVLRALVVPS